MTQKWTPDLIKQYESHVSLIIESITAEDIRYTCEDFAITVLATFARDNGLPFKWETGAKSYDADDPNFTNFETFLTQIKMTTGAADFKNNINTTPVTKDKISLGTNVLHSSIGKKNPHHISVVTGLAYDEQKSVSAYCWSQGNFRGGIMYDRLLGSKTPDDWNYHGDFVQQGVYFVGWDIWNNETRAIQTSYYSLSQELSYRNFNFMKMNVEYKYKKVTITTTVSSPTTLVPTTSESTVYERCDDDCK